MLRSVLLAVAATLSAVPSATAATDDLPVRQPDPVGDVVIFDGGGTKPTTGQRRTIDLEQFRVTRRGDGVRFTFRIARITRSRNFDQVVTVQLRKPGRDGVVLDVLANPQHRTGNAVLGLTTMCGVDVSVARRTGTVRVDLGDECLPSVAGVLRAVTYTQERNGSGPGFSEDTLRVPGLVSLR
jgi:hypothetical protein